MTLDKWDQVQGLPTGFTVAQCRQRFFKMHVSVSEMSGAGAVCDLYPSGTHLSSPLSVGNFVIVHDYLAQSLGSRTCYLVPWATPSIAPPWMPLVLRVSITPSCNGWAPRSQSRKRCLLYRLTLESVTRAFRPEL